MVALVPLDVDFVVAHGDFSLDNVLLAERGKGDGFDVVGCLDVGRVDVADRYQGLAILYDCLTEFGDALQARVFIEYGIVAVEVRVTSSCTNVGSDTSHRTRATPAQTLLRPTRCPCSSA